MNAISHAKAKLDAQNVQELKQALENLTQVNHKIAAELYKTTTPADNNAHSHNNDASSAHNNANDPKDNVIDADFKEAK